MTDERSDAMDASRLRQRALSRWENEGGAATSGDNFSLPADDQYDVPPLTNAELSQLHIRVIALEALVAVLLVDASERQLQLAREMAAYISPRSGFAEHRLTIRAALRMRDLVDRADRFRAVTEP